MGSINRSLDKLQLNNRALRICINAPNRIPRIKLLYLTQIPELKYRCTAHLRNFIFKRKNRPEYIDQKPARTRLHDGVLMETYKANYAAVDRSVSYKGPREWNNLSVQDRNIQTYGTFKFRQKKCLQSKIPIPDNVC